VLQKREIDEAREEASKQRRARGRDGGLDLLLRSPFAAVIENLNDERCRRGPAARREVYEDE
jgi:hypothetical protein